MERDEWLMIQMTGPLALSVFWFRFPSPSDWARQRADPSGRLVYKQRVKWAPGSLDLPTQNIEVIKVYPFTSFNGY